MRGGDLSRWPDGLETPAVAGAALRRAARRPWLMSAWVSSGLPAGWLGWPARPSRLAEGLRLRRRAGEAMAAAASAAGAAGRARMPRSGGGGRLVPVGGDRCARRSPLQLMQVGCRGAQTARRRRRSGSAGD